MQSPGALAFRAFVMLVTLVAVPGIALFWESMPGMVDKLLATFEQRLGLHLSGSGVVRLASDGKGVNDRRLTDAPRFSPSPEPPLGPSSEPGLIAGEWAEEPRVLPVQSSTSPWGAAARASYEVPLQRPEGGPGQRNRSGGRSSQPASAAENPATSDRFTAIQMRLRDLGASYYLLESWGINGTQYRFHCRMAVIGNERYFRQFEAMADDPLSAMAEVLRQVEQWRAGRQP